jgi:hypothetical protein
MSFHPEFSVVCFLGNEPKFAVTDSLAPSLADQVQRYLNGLRGKRIGGESRRHNFRQLAQHEIPANLPVHKNLAQEIITGKMLFS